MFAQRRALITLSGSVVLEALRGRLGWLLLLVIALGMGLAEFVAAIAITESREVAVLVLAAWLRLSVAFIVALFVVSSMVRETQDKGMELVLALPISRSAYLLGRLSGYLLCALAAGLACAATLTLHVPLTVAAAWGASFAMELLIIVAAGTLCVLTLAQVTLAMTALAAFYLLARSMEAVQLMARHPVVGGDALLQDLVRGLVQAIDWVLPELHALAPGAWLLAGEVAMAELLQGIAAAALYLLLIVAMALFDMERKVL
jgi:hypothetical protein